MFTSMMRKYMFDTQTCYITASKVVVTLQRMSSAYACVWRLFGIRCHTLMHVGNTSGARCANVQSMLSYALVRRSSFRTPRNFMQAHKFSAYADVRFIRSTLCTRYANVPRVRGALDVRWRNVHSTLTLVDTKYVNFTTSPLCVGSRLWTFCRRTVCVLSAYAYCIKIEGTLVNVFIARSHRMQNEQVVYASWWSNVCSVCLTGCQRYAYKL